jgi:hypothetical protein
MNDLRAAAQQALEALEDWDSPVALPAITALRAALEQQEQTCNCRWVGDVQTQQCTLHEAHVDAIHEWAERAKAAEAKLAALTQQEQEPVAYTGDVARRMREAGMTFHLGMPHAAVMEQMTRFHDLVCAEASIKAAVAFATPPRRETEQKPVALFTKYGPPTMRDRDFWSAGYAAGAARAIEAALKERNT